jgi:hypothetical protein
MRRLRVEYELEFIYADLSGDAREKVMKYATLWKGWEERRRKRVGRERQRAARKVSVPIPHDADAENDDEPDEMEGVLEADVMMGGRAGAEK